MPRNGSGVYSKPAGTTAVSNTTIESADFNSVVDDLVTDANIARPITAGGTGRNTARLLDGTWRFENTADPTKLLAISLSGLTTATTRTITMGDSDVTLRPQAWELISTQTISSSTAVMDFTGLSAYRRLRLSGYVIPVTDNVGIFLRTSTNNGSTFDAAATHYSHVAARGLIASASGLGLGSNTTGAASAIQICGTGSVGGLDANEGVTFSLDVHEFNQTLFAKVNGTFFTVIEDATIMAGAVGGTRLENVARDALRILPSSGNIARAFVTLEGIRG